MEDRKTALAIFLCLTVVILYSNLILAPKMRPAPPVPQTAAVSQATATAPAQIASSANTTSQIVPATQAAQSAVAGRPTPVEIEAAPATIIHAENFEVAFTHLGARITHFKLSHYKDHLGADSPLDLVTHSEGGVLPLGVYIGLNSLTDERTQYKLSSISGTTVDSQGQQWLAKDSEAVLTFVGALTPNISITKKITFKSGSYLFTVDVALSQPLAESSNVWLEWTHFIPTNEAHSKLDPKDFLVLTEAARITHITSADFKTGIVDQGNNKWVGMGNKYFMTLLVPDTASSINTRIGKEGDTYLVRTSGKTNGGTFTVYVGPKDASILESLPHQLERGIDLGIFSFLAFPLLSLIRVFYTWLGNYGLAIILLTLLIKALFLPLTKASFKSMKAMQDLQPEIKALRERMKDPTQLNQEVMALYKRRGVNPLGGCLPMLVQLPVFLGLYNALLYSIEMRHAPFALWITDLSAPEGLQIMGIGIPVMVLLMGASMYVQQATTPAMGDPQQQKMMKMMPVIFTLLFIIFPMPAGLVLYWLVSNIISIIQQMYLRGTKNFSPTYATAVASVCIFIVGFLLTLLPRWS